MPQEKYRDHKITYEAKQTPGSKYWLGNAKVQVDDVRAVQFFPFIGPFDKYSSEKRQNSTSSKPQGTSSMGLF
jgi:hypothetical protein